MDKKKDDKNDKNSKIHKKAMITIGEPIKFGIIMALISRNFSYKIIRKRRIRIRNIFSVFFYASLIFYTISFSKRLK